MWVNTLPDLLTAGFASKSDARFENIFHLPGTQNGKLLVTKAQVYSYTHK